MSSGSALPAIRCQTTSLARNNVPDGNAIVATSIWLLAAEVSALTRWGSARSARTTTTQSEIRNSMARIILAGIAVYLARGV
jgi:hypothetical protein